MDLSVTTPAIEAQLPPLEELLEWTLCGVKVRDLQRPHPATCTACGCSDGLAYPYPLPESTFWCPNCSPAWLKSYLDFTLTFDGGPYIRGIREQLRDRVRRGLSARSRRKR